jgi:ESF2/ABP1 family protein
MSADHKNISEEHQNESDLEDESHLDEPQEKKTKKIKKPGIIYMPTIPPNMTVLKMREILQEFGDIGRVFLQPDEKPGEYFFL